MHDPNPAPPPALPRRMNLRLVAARERLFSAARPNKKLGRAELAARINDYLAATYPDRTHTQLGASSIGRYENGVVRYPRGALRSAFRHVLSEGLPDLLTDAELGFYDYFAPNSPEPDAGADADPASATPALAARAEVRTLEVTGAIQAATDLREALVEAADGSSDVQAWLDTSPVDDLAADALLEDLRQVTRDYLILPTERLLARTVQLRDRAVTLLDQRGAPKLTGELYTAAGWSLVLLAWMSVDHGEPQLAEQHARAAWTCAERADDNPLRAWVRATQHTTAYWSGHHLRAARYAEHGLRLPDTGTAAVFLAGALALDLARAGDHDEARAALLAARRTAEQAVPLEQELHGPFTCPPERAAALWSDTELALGDARDALASADRAVLTQSGRPAEQINAGSLRMTQLLQVQAHLLLGDPSAARQALAPVLDTPPEHRARPLLLRVDDITATTAAMRAPEDPAVLALRRDLRELRAAEPDGALPG